MSSEGRACAVEEEEEEGAFRAEAIGESSRRCIDGKGKGEGKE